MATATPPGSTRRLEQDHQRIRHPLDRLRKYINSYVALEAAALMGLLLTLAFWVGLVLDYGSFAAIRLDWVQLLPWGVRLGLLSVFTVLTVSLLLFLVLTRLFKQFGDAPLALLLERRFPKVLGDRLITAVELASPKKAAKYGYSADLVAETIHEAADCVEQVPVGEVFNWKRLKRYALILVVLTLGLYLLSGAGFCGTRLLYQEAPVAAGVSDFHDVVGMWAERNILLRNVYWPRRAHLELLPFYPDDPHREPRIARDAPSPLLRVRAWKYVLADSSAEEGWRMLRWQDVENNKALAGDSDVPELPGDWKARDPEYGMTVDEVELRFDAFPVRTTPPPDEELPAAYSISTPEGDWRPLLWSDLNRDRLGGLNVPALPDSWDLKARARLGASGAGLGSLGPLPTAARLAAGPTGANLSVADVKAAVEKFEESGAGKGDKEMLAQVRMILARLDRLGEVRSALDRIDLRSADRSMRRTMRKLIIPENVTLVYNSRRASNTVTMTRAAENLFTGNFGELKETITYYVRGEDYSTPTRRLVVVELPRLERLESEEERPAYIYYRPSEGNSAAELRGARQPFEPMPISLSGEVSSREVPAGTTVVLRGIATKPLEEVKITALPRDLKTLAADVVKLLDENTFEVKIPDVRREQRFVFEFKDTDGVRGRRGVTITPREDVAPRIREFNPDEVIRKTREGHMVAVGCRIPFKARIRDDHGLARIRYGCKVIPADFLSDQKIYALNGVAGVSMLGMPGTRMQGIGYLLALNKQLASYATDEESEEQYVEVPAFTQALLRSQTSDGRNEVLARGTVLSLLAAKQKDPFRKLLSDFSIMPDNWMSNDEEGGTEPSKWVRARDQRAPLGCDLPVWQLRYKGLPLKDPDERKAQKRYIIEVRLLVDDTYAEGEFNPKTREPIPHTSPSSETFTIVVVPEHELRSKIQEEEDAKYTELAKLLKPLGDNLKLFREIVLNLTGSTVSASELNNMISRCDSLEETLKAAHQDTKAIVATYDRVIREMRVNQMQENLTQKVYQNIYRPLSSIAEVQFDRTLVADRALRTALGDKEATPAARAKLGRDTRDQLNSLITQIDDVLKKMKTLAELKALIQKLDTIKNEETEFARKMKQLYEDLIRKEFEGDPKKDPKKR